MGREVEKYDFKAFGQAIKAARKMQRASNGSVSCLDFSSV